MLLEQSARGMTRVREISNRKNGMFETIRLVAIVLCDSSQVPSRHTRTRRSQVRVGNT
jgi:hypothetical protein